MLRRGNNTFWLVRALVLGVLVSLPAMAFSGLGAARGGNHSGNENSESPRSEREVVRTTVAEGGGGGGHGRGAVDPSAPPGATGVAAGSSAAATSPVDSHLTPGGGGGGNGDGGPSGLYQSGAQEHSAASETSQIKSEESLEKAEHERNISGRERATADSISRDSNFVDQNIKPLLASPDQGQRNRGEQMLGQSLSPPAKVAKIYEGLNLRTNRDIQDRGNEIVKNLTEASQEHDKQAEFFTDQAQKGFAAAAKMDQFRNTLNQRNDNLDSLTEGAVTSKKEAFQNSATGAGSINGKSDGGIKNGLTAESDLKYENKEAADKSKTVGKPGDASENASKITDARSTKLSSGESLAEKLRLALAAGKKSSKHGKEGGDKEGDRAPASAFDAIFQGKAKKDGKDSEITASDGKTNGKIFHMSEVETDQTVKRLVDSLHSQVGDSKSDREIFGNTDVTIFVRMKAYLTKAQVEKRL